MPDLAPVNSNTISIEGTEYRVVDLSFSALRVHYFTGVAVRKLGDQRSNTHYLLHVREIGGHT